MRVAVDATPLILSSGGLARYTSELSLALAETFPEDEVLLVSDQEFAMPEGAPQNLRRGSGPHGRLERRWWVWGLTKELGRLRADIFHGTDFAVPYVPLRPSVLTLHDLSPWMDPRWHHAAERVRRRTPVLVGLGIATMVLTDSQAVRRQAIEHFRLSPQRVMAVPLAAGRHFRPVEPGQTKPYFLYVGTLEPRKNLPLLMAAWREVRKQVDIDLVLAGRRREDFPEPAVEPGLRLAGEVADGELPGLYSGALAFVYPSHYEGFGLPVLEAMQCGACVITSRDPAVGEVAGDAAVRAGSEQELVEAMLAAARNPAWVAARREQSLRRAREFSWEHTARLTREVYAEAQRRFVY
ncbi:MAG TPA: glycosyltransferase family 1 protein [Bryobacteraceae bacterium]|nr:glycosyltransferase family 1 protein [Bryobacteraceae bacterium]